MRKLFKKGFVFAAACLLSAAVIGTNAYASDDVLDKDASGNVFAAGQLVNVGNQAGVTVDNELFVAGMDVDASGVDVDGSIFIAGQSVTVKNANAGGSVFAAGSNVVLDIDAKNNIWVVGNILTVGDNTEVKGLHAAGNNISVGGKYDAVSIDGSTVIFNAEVEGDVEINAESVTFGKDAKIGGNLTVKAQNEPEGASDVASGNYNFELVETQTEEGENGTSESIVKTAGKAAIGAIILKKVKKVVLNLFRYALLAVVFVALFKKDLNKSYEYATKRAGAFWGFGALFLVFFPLIAIICAVTVIGLPVSLFATTIYILAIACAKVFTFGSLVRELIFRHTSKRLHPMAETVLSVLPAAIIGVIPFVKGLVGFACAIYAIGYVCLAIAETVAGNREPKKAVNSEVSE